MGVLLFVVGSFLFVANLLFAFASPMPISIVSWIGAGFAVWMAYNAAGMIANGD